MKYKEIQFLKIEKPENDISIGVIIGQSHFIKTVEDLHEVMVNSVPSSKFGLAFCEASGVKKVRFSGTDDEMIKLAVENAKLLKAGHVFIIFIKDTYPINYLKNIKDVPEVCNIFCATSNPLEVIIAESELGRGVIGVIDGENSGIEENEEEKKERHDFLRKIGYKMY